MGFNQDQSEYVNRRKPDGNQIIKKEYLLKTIPVCVWSNRLIYLAQVPIEFEIGKDLHKTASKREEGKRKAIQKEQRKSYRQRKRKDETQKSTHKDWKKKDWGRMSTPINFFLMDSCLCLIKEKRFGRI